MLERLARFILGLSVVACGAPGSAEPGRSSAAAEVVFGDELNEAEIAGDARPKPVATGGEALCPIARRETELPRNAGSPLWLQGFDAMEVTSVASDSEGSVVLARSGTEVTKLSCAGEVLWSKPFGTHVAIDDQDAVYVAGTFTDALAVDERTLRTDGTAAFLVKLDRAGHVAYAHALGPAAAGAIDSLAVDGAGHVALSGPGFGTMKLDESGGVLWQKAFSGKVQLDATGDVVLAGELVGTLDLGTARLISQGGADVLLLRLGPDGTPVFARSYGDPGALQRAQAITVDDEGNVVIAGTFDGRVDFGIGALELTPAQCSSDAWCVTDGFATKFDAQGQALWSVAFGPMRAVSGLASDADGNVVLSGALPGGVRPFRQTWLAKLDPKGAEIWHRSEWPDTGIGAGHGVAVDANAQVFWSLSARPSLDLEERSYLAKLSP